MAVIRRRYGVTAASLTAQSRTSCSNPFRNDRPRPNQARAGAGEAGVVSTMPPKSVLDACCGSRMFWFDKSDQRALFVDKRRESHILKDASSSTGSRSLIVDP